MQISSSRIWTWVAESIFNDNKRYSTSASTKKNFANMVVNSQHLITKQEMGSSYGVVANVLDCTILVSEFEH